MNCKNEIALVYNTPSFYEDFVKIQKCDSHVVSGIGQSCLTLLEDIYLPTFGCDIIIMIPLLLLSMFDGKICSNG